LTNYQPVTRDFAFILSRATPTGDVIKEIAKCSDLIQEVSIFDVFESEQLGDNKSVAITIRIQPTDKTLEEKEILTICETIVAMAKTKFNATLRS
jgi:phenylalanyl-tRNA synthetase beta chain